MSRSAMLGFVAFVGLLGSLVGSASAQAVERMPQNRTLDAPFPSAHAYIIEVWFSPQNKAGTFKAKVYDPGVPGDYNRQAWEAYRTKMNAPDSGWVSRRIDFTTGQGNRPTERQQLLERINQERARLEFQTIKPVDVKPRTSDQPKSSAATHGFAYKKDAGSTTASLDGTTWINSSPSGGATLKEVWTFQSGGRLRVLYHLRGGQVDDQAADREYGGISTWSQQGNTFATKYRSYSGKITSAGSGSIQGNTIRFTERSSDGVPYQTTLTKQQ